MGIDARIYAKARRQFTDAEVLRLSYEIGLTFGADKFRRIEGSKNKETGEVYWLPHHNISRETKIEQDGPDVDPLPGETFLEVHVWASYYGPGYERGDLPFLISIAEWLDRKIPGCTVLYGGDSSGVCAEPFGPEQRAALMDHFASDQGRSYFTHANPFMDDLPPPLPDCELCKVPMPQFGYGPGKLCGSFYCGGCDARKKTSDGVAYARMKLRDAWEAHQCGPVVPCGEAFERAHEAQTAILEAIEALAAELHGGGHG